MIRRKKATGLLIALFMIISILSLETQVVDASVKWDKGVNTGYWWGESGDINILKINGEASYCVEPDKIINSVKGYEETAPQFTTEQWTRLILIAHFGYGSVNNSNADFAATQVMMWRDIWKWKGFEPVSISKSNIPNLSEKIEKIERNINIYNKVINNMPLFKLDKSPIEIIAGKNYTLRDINDMIGAYPYKIVNTPEGVDVSIDKKNNSLNIRAEHDSVEQGKIVLQLDFSNSVFKNRFYYHSISQNAASIGHLEKVEMNIELRIDKTGKVKLIKKSDTDKSIEGVIFNFKNLETEEEKEYKTGNDGEILTENMLAGNYEVREIYTPAPYLLDKSVQNVEVIPGETAEVSFENKMPRGELILTKYDEDKKTRLEGAEYRIWSKGENPEGELINYDEKILTDRNGTIRIENLKLGKYFYKELKAPKGYIIDDTVYEFEIKYEDMETSNLKVQKDVVNKKSIKLVKTGDNFYIGGIIVVSILALLGTLFMLKSKKRK